MKTNVKLAEIKDVTKIKRVNDHSYRGFGIGGDILYQTNRIIKMIGQAKARKSAELIIQKIKQGQIAGRAILIEGQSGTGKSVIAMAIAKSLGEDIPFTLISGSQVYSLQMSKNESLSQAFRKSIGIRIKQQSEIIQGQVMKIQFQKSLISKPKTGKITLKTTEMETVYDLSQKMIDFCYKQKIVCGDVIKIDIASEKAQKVGKSFAFACECDLMGTQQRFVNCPSGQIQKKKEIVHTVTLHQIDAINPRSQGFSNLYLGQFKQISSQSRQGIDAIISQWIQQGKAEIVPGVLFINEAHMLDMECFSFLNKILKNKKAPILILSTNKDISNTRETNQKQQQDMPLDLLDNFLIIKTQKYSQYQLSKIIQTKCQQQDVQISQQALEFLTKISQQTTLRYAIQLIIISCQLSVKRKASQIQLQDIRRAYSLFFDRKRSTQQLEQHQQKSLVRQPTKNKKNETQVQN